MQVAGLRGAEECSVNEVAGFVWRCSAQSAGHMTDYNIDQGTIMMLGGSRWRQITKLAIRAKLLTEHRLNGNRVWRLIEDPEFIHIRLRAAVEWDRQRDKDRKNPDLTNPVLLRDGDVCRYCDQVVNLDDHRGARGLTFDHRQPGQPATLDNYVVACKGCNSKRLASLDADQRWPLLPPPSEPYYSPKTAERLTAYFGRPILATTSRPGTPPDTARTTSRPGTPPDTARTTSRPGTPSDTAQPDWGGTATVPPPSWATDPVGLPRVFPGSRGGTRVGTGNGSGVGSGLDGQGASPPPAKPPPSDPTPPNGRRSKRGRRSR
jgi:hypothetical protein